MAKFYAPTTIALSFLCVLACGRADEQTVTSAEEGVATVESEQTTTLTNACSEFPLPEAKATDYCKPMPDGSTYHVTLNPAVYIQDPTSCEITTKDDGMRLGMVEMGFAPCDLDETSSALDH